ncbi:MAG: peptidoglycan DD-metalloendopeptidase family protein [Prevotella sp.]|nr:peptidoglycan DD-metalloendopeptidase family protein [Prevotella sp.]
MKRLLIILIAALVCLAPTDAQTKKASSTQKKTATTQKKATTTQKKTTTKKSSSGSASRGSTTTSSTKNKKGKGKKTATPTTNEIKGLQNQRAALQKKIKEQEQLLQKNRATVKERLNTLMVINSEIGQRQKSIEEIQKDITGIEGNIDLLKTQLETLEKQLDERKEKYIKSLRYMARHRSIQDQLMFIFSAKNFTQMYRRLRFVREYAAYQRAQGELVKVKQEQIASKHAELEKQKGQKASLLNKGKQEQAALQVKQTEQQEMVNTLQKQQKTIQGIIDDQKKKDAQLNVEIDRLVAIEVAKAKARAEEEARKKAAAEAAAKKKHQEELARKKAEAEKAARENERRIAEAKEREAKAKAAAKAAAKKSEAEKAKAEKAANQARADREAAELKAKVDRERHTKEVKEATKKSNEAAMMTSVDRKLSSNFESNRGRLPIPITGSYRIVSHYGQYNVEGLRGVTLDNKGVNIKGNPGCQARAIFDGEVSAVFNFQGSNVVMVRHGGYISVYCNLSSVSVARGQHVSARQALGTVGSDNILQFQLRKGNTKLNPESWLGR